ncbi:PEP-CTERM sorting domain-containing protein [Pontiellaceae bacterium B12227]|nr:PEP-CTERM sorting domain-containing protein [Pontiellaceae bacterium B12227]
MKRIHAGLTVVMLSVLASHGALVAHYDFGDGNLTDDSSGNGIVLTEGGPGTGVTLNADGFSARFEETGGTQANFFTANSMDHSGAFTLSFWWKTPTLDQASAESLMSSGAGDSWQIDWRSPAGAPSNQLRVSDDSGNAMFVLTSTLSADTWYHMVLTSDGTGTGASGNNAAFYNTVQGGALNLLGSTVAAIDLVDLRIGANRGGNQTYDSDIASVAVYDTVLSAAELNVLLNAGPAAIPEPATLGLIGATGLGLLFIRRFRM